MTEPILAVSGLSKAYRGRPALSSVDLHLQPGELLGLLGPNGAGKSTLFQILTGLIGADSGTVSFAGAVVDPSDSALRSACGVVFQSASLDKLLGARENLILSGRLYGIDKPTCATRADRLLDLVGLADRAKDPVKEFSGGMKRRLELARALMNEPKILLMDEPTSGLDEAQFRQVWGYLDRLREGAGVSILLVTHRAEEAERCDRLMILDQGQVVAEGTPDALRAELDGDTILLESDDLEALARQIDEAFDVAPEIVDGRVTLCLPDAHLFVPKLVDRLPSGALTSLSLRRPTMGDVFVSLTGHSLAEDR
jgi:ABC-2 type transport system ATP-binding protein